MSANNASPGALEAGIGVGAGPGPTKQDIEERPWKFRGYKDLTSFVASDPATFVARRFDRIHVRAILTLQAQLEEMEEELDALDAEYSLEHVKAVGAEPPEVIKGAISPEKLAELVTRFGALGEPRDINNGTVRDDMPQRAALIAGITQKLEQYDRLLLQYFQLHNQPLAPQYNIQNVQTWFAHNDGVIMDDEQNFARETGELICFSKPKPPLRMLFESRVLMRSKTLFRSFRKDVPHVSSHDKMEARFYDDGLVDRLTLLTMLMAVVAMLIAPLWILQALGDTRAKLGVITAFVVVWLCLLSYGVQGKVFEKLAGTAGYAAILVVFLQVGSNGGQTT